MMPLLSEMPEGRMGIHVMQQAVHTTLFGEPPCLGWPAVPIGCTYILSASFARRYVCPATAALCMRAHSRAWLLR
jgi:hypothetical protein